MDQANFQRTWEGSVPVLFNQQQDDDPGSINLALEDLRSFYAGFPTFATPGASLPSGPDFSGFLPPSPAYIGFEQSPGASLLPRQDFPGPTRHATSPLLSSGFSGFLPPSPAYTDFGRSLHASLIPSPANAALSSFQEAASTCLPPCTAYASFEQVSGASQVPSSAWIGYRSQNNEPPLPQPQPDYGEDFPNYAFNQVTLPLTAHGECQYPTNGGNPQQNILPWLQHQSNTVSLRHYDDSSHVPSYFEQILPVTFNSQPKPQRCIRCRKQGKSCIKNASNGDSRCLRCVTQAIPASICKQDTDMTWLKPFDRCVDKGHRLRSIHVRSSVLNSPIMTHLRHYPNGPTLDVECCEFGVTPETDKTQIFVLRNNRSGCGWMRSPAYQLANPKINLSLYLQDSVRFFKDEACRRGQSPVSFFYKQARIYEHFLIIQQCFEMHAVHRLIVGGWQFSGKKCLGIETVKERHSMFYGFKYVPCMVHKQLNHALELKIMELDKKILKGARGIMAKGGRRMWIVGFLALFFLLHIREIDAGEIVDWTRPYPGLNDFWTYSSDPTTLINKTITSCNSILSHFHCSAWRKPLYLNWDDQKSRDMVDNDSTVISSMKALQTHVEEQRKRSLIGRKACELYKTGNPYSVEFTVSSLLFESTEEGCEVRDFFSIK